MGSSSSKAAAGAVTRKYPTRIPPTATISRPPRAKPPSNAEPTANRPLDSRDEALHPDGPDARYAAALRSLGAVQPHPMSSPASTFDARSPLTSSGAAPDPSSNPAIQIVMARDRLEAAAEKEFAEAGLRGSAGRRFLDVYTVRQMLVMRDERRLPPDEIERRLGLGPGMVERLGPPGMLGLPSQAGL